MLLAVAGMFAVVSGGRRAPGITGEGCMPLLLKLVCRECAPEPAGPMAISRPSELGSPRGIVAGEPPPPWRMDMLGDEPPALESVLDLNG